MAARAPVFLRLRAGGAVALAVFGLLCAAPGGPPLSAAISLKIGDPAPPFSLRGSDGVTYRLSDYTGKRAVVLAWFAKAFTSG
jgi:peroxiredoxin Q/BCP